MKTLSKYTMDIKDEDEYETRKNIGHYDEIVDYIFQFDDIAEIKEVLISYNDEIIRGISITTESMITTPPLLISMEKFIDRMKQEFPQFNFNFNII